MALSPYPTDNVGISRANSDKCDRTQLPVQTVQVSFQQPVLSGLKEGEDDTPHLCQA